MTLRVCESCARHVKEAAVTCRFCGAIVGPREAPQVRTGARSRLGVLLAGAMAIGGGRPSCGSGTGGGEIYGGPPIGPDAAAVPAPVYGGPPPMPDPVPIAMPDASVLDSGGDAAVKPKPAPTPTRTAVPAYGLAPLHPPDPYPTTK